MLQTLRLKAGPPARVLFGHPWAFIGEIISNGPLPKSGDCVELLDLKGQSLGSGLWSTKSQIAWRRYSHRLVSLDGPLLDELIVAAIRRRNNQPVCRLVWSEADNLPGLVVDRYNDLLSVQALTFGIDQRLPQIIDCLKRELQPREIVIRNDASVRKLEGLESSITTASGNPLEPCWMKVGDIEVRVDLVGGQKTGMYLDQIQQHARIAQFAKGRRVLDAFCNQGGFGLACAKAGALSVLGLDSSEDAIKAAQLAAERNSLNAKFEVANVFDWFGANREVTFDLIILDPPPFARSKESVDGAMRGYKELNLRALRLLSPNGILATYSCSHRISDEMYFDVIESAARDARRQAVLLERTSQPSDHPILINFPESRYLKGFILEVRS